MRSDDAKAQTSGKRRDYVLVFAVACLSLVLAVSCARNEIGANSPNSQIVSATYHGEGEVVGVDCERRTVKLNHGEIKGYMDAMTMDFHVADKKLLDGIQPGDRVDFTLQDTANVVKVTEIKKRLSQ